MSKKNRPRIRIKTTPVDMVVETIGMLALIFLFVLPASYYGDMPDQIPQHFGPDGKPDSYGSKTFIWFLPIIGLVLYIGLTALNRFPHIFNFPVRITPENAEKQYRIATRAIRFLKLLILVLFLYITKSIIKSSVGASNGLDSVFMFIMIGLITATAVVMIMLSFKNR